MKTKFNGYHETQSARHSGVRLPNCVQYSRISIMRFSAPFDMMIVALCAIFNSFFRQHIIFNSSLVSRFVFSL